jgi:putative inorganic carbon (hco3(-)) transporter
MEQIRVLAEPLRPVRPVRSDVLLALIAASVLFVVLLIGGIGGAWAAVALLALIALGFAKPEVATLTVVFVIYANLAPVAVRSHGVPKLLAMSFFALLLLPAAYYVMARGEAIRTDKTLGLMCLYLGVQLASVIFARNMSDSLAVVASYVTEGLAIYLLILNTVRTAAVLRRCLWAMVAAGVLLGSATLVQNRTYRYDRDFGGLALTHTSTTQQEAVMGSEEGGRVDEGRPRAMGPIGDPNFYAQIMVVLLPIVALRLWAERKRSLRWLAALAIVPILAGMVLTFSRGAGLAALFFCVALVALRYLKVRYAVIPLVAAVIVVALTPDYASRLSTLTKMASPGMRAADSSLRERTTIYLSGIQVFLDHPVLGVGVGQVQEYLPEYSNYIGHSRLQRKMGAHNMYLETLAETGILGFAAFMAIVATVVRRLWRVRQYWKVRQPEYVHTATSLLLALAVFLVTGLFLHLAYARYFWLLLAIAGAACAVYQPPLETKENSFARCPTATPGLFGDMRFDDMKPISGSSSF